MKIIIIMIMSPKDFSRQGSSGQTSDPITSQPTPPSFESEGADDLKTMLGGKRSNMRNAK